MVIVFIEGLNNPRWLLHIAHVQLRCKSEYFELRSMPALSHRLRGCLEPLPRLALLDQATKTPFALLSISSQGLCSRRQVSACCCEPAKSALHGRQGKLARLPVKAKQGETTKRALKLLQWLWWMSGCCCSSTRWYIHHNVLSVFYDKNTGGTESENRN